MEDDNALSDLDLTAWKYPASELSADELAERVIARRRNTRAAALPIDERETELQDTRRSLLIGGIAVAVLAVAIGAWAILKGKQPAVPAEGSVLAQHTQTLELDGVRAELDAGAEVTWSREGSVLRIQQRTGSATWHVRTDRNVVIEAGAALASVEATGATLRMEIKSMNATDVRIAGAVAIVVVATVAVYEGYARVHDASTHKTTVVRPGTPYTTNAGPKPVDNPVVGAARIDADQVPDVTLNAGDSVVIHDMRPPTRVEIDTHTSCIGPAQLVVDGVQPPSAVLSLAEGTATYHVMCDGLDSATGEITVVEDTLARQMPVVSPLNEVNMDGRVYHITFLQAVPTLDVHGGPGTLHVARGAIEKTYEARGQTVRVPSADLGAGEFKLWFSPDQMTTIVLQLDTAAPIMSLNPLTWGSQVQLQGETLVGTTLTFDGVAIPVDGSGRFNAFVPSNGRTVVMRLQNPNAGLHYAIARAPTRTPVSPRP